MYWCGQDSLKQLAHSHRGRTRGFAVALTLIHGYFLNLFFARIPLTGYILLNKNKEGSPCQPMYSLFFLQKGHKDQLWLSSQEQGIPLLWVLLHPSFNLKDANFPQGMSWQPHPDFHSISLEIISPWRKDSCENKSVIQFVWFVSPLYMSCLSSKFLEYLSIFILSAKKVFVASLLLGFISLQEFTTTLEI